MEKKQRWMQWLVWVAQGIVVGFGAILPGISGGALLAAFGLYKPVLTVIASPLKEIKNYFWMFCCIGIGGLIGFVGLSGLVNLLLERREALVKCVFIGFILGTLPALWQDAGRSLDWQKFPFHRGTDWAALLLGFAGTFGVLLALNSTSAMHLQPGTLGFGFCGVCWGLCFLVPGISASSLLIFFGLYQAMLEGISRLDMGVCIPLGVGMLLVLLLLTRPVKAAFTRWDAGMSHVILGIVVATTVMIFPSPAASVSGWLAYILCIVVGSGVSYLLGWLCSRFAARDTSHP